MAVNDHPMKALKGTAEGRALMAAVRSHRAKPVEGSPAEEAAESPSFEKKEDDTAGKTDPFTAADRKSLAAKGEAMPGGRYPIRNATDLENAYKDWVRTGKPSDVTAWIGKRARQLGLPNPVTGNHTSYDAVIAAHTKTKAKG